MRQQADRSGVSTPYAGNLLLEETPQEGLSSRSETSQPPTRGICSSRLVRECALKERFVVSTPYAGNLLLEARPPTSLASRWSGLNPLRGESAPRGGKDGFGTETGIGSLNPLRGESAPRGPSSSIQRSYDYSVSTPYAGNLLLEVTAHNRLGFVVRCLNPLRGESAPRGYDYVHVSAGGVSSQPPTRGICSSRAIGAIGDAILGLESQPPTRGICSSRRIGFLQFSFDSAVSTPYAGNLLLEDRSPDCPLRSPRVSTPYAGNLLLEVPATAMRTLGAGCRLNPLRGESAPRGKL